MEFKCLSRLIQLAKYMRVRGYVWRGLIFGFLQYAGFECKIRTKQKIIKSSSTILGLIKSTLHLHCFVSLTKLIVYFLCQYL